MATTVWTLASYPCTAKRLMLDSAGVVSLLGLMKILRVGEVATMLDGLRVLVDVQKRKRASVGGDARLHREDMVHVGELSQQGRELFSSIEFDDAAKRFALFEAGILSDSTVARMQSEVENLIAAIIGELQKRAFFFVSLDRNNLLTQYPFGEDVAKAFPSARNDIGQAAVGLAMELHLASVFHLMRVAEGGLRCLAQDRRIVFPADIKLQAWEEVLRELEKSEAKIQNYPKTLRREEQFEFYHGAMMELKRFKNLWRNRIMHLRNEPVDRDQALSTFNHIKAFMAILARHISENSPPTPEIWI